MIQRLRLTQMQYFVAQVALLFLCSLASSYARGEPDAPMKHFQYGPLDRFRASAESVLKKHVLTYWVIGYQLEHGSDPVKYPNTTHEFQEFTSDKDYKVLTGGDWAFITPSRFLFEKIVPIGTKTTVIERPWKSLAMHVITTKDSGSESPTTAAQLSELETQLLQSSRFVPMNDTDEGFHEETAVFRLWYQVYIRRLRKNGPLSVVILERQNEAAAAQSDEALEKQAFQLDNGRLIYGEMQDSRIRLLWDSPLVQIRHTKQLEFRDVDGDGNKEIMVWGSINEGTYEWRTLSIFNLDGLEITRQDCEGNRLSWYNNAYGEKACPISGGSEGSDVDLDCASLPCIIYGGLNENPDLADVFRFINGHYVSQGQSKNPHSAKTLNEEGMELMRVKSYAAAADKFTEAFHLDPNEAEFANNVGFAWYRAGKVQDSVLWFQQAVSLDPMRAVAYLNLGDAYGKLNNNAGARRAYTKYLELAPSSKSAPDVKKKLDALPKSP